MRLLMSMVAAAAIFLPTVTAAPAAYTNPHPRVQPGSCYALSAKLGQSKVWQAAFSAQRLDVFDHPEWINVAPCFATHADCFNWLYWAQTDWPDQNYVGFCKRGMPYSH
jgi:hypothetical protein